MIDFPDLYDIPDKNTTCSTTTTNFATDLSCNITKNRAKIWGNPDSFNG